MFFALFVVIEFHILTPFRAVTPRFPFRHYYGENLKIAKLKITFLKKTYTKRKNARLKIQSDINRAIYLYLLMCVFIFAAVISRWQVKGFFNKILLIIELCRNKMNTTLPPKDTAISLKRATLLSPRNSILEKKTAALHSLP